MHASSLCPFTALLMFSLQTSLLQGTVLQSLVHHNIRHAHAAIPVFNTAVTQIWSRYEAALMHVQSTGHYILQLEHMHRPDPAQPQLLETQEMPAQMLQLGPPLFKLAGLAIGNGLTDPKLQVILLPLLLQDVACAAAAFHCCC